MVYQAPRERCLPNWPKTRVFDLREMNWSVAPMLSCRNLTGKADFSDSTRWNAKDQETL